MKLGMREEAYTNIIKADVFGDWEMEVFFGSNLINMLSFKVLRVRFVESDEGIFQRREALMVSELSIWEERRSSRGSKTVPTSRGRVSRLGDGAASRRQVGERAWATPMMAHFRDLPQAR